MQSASRERCEAPEFHRLEHASRSELHRNTCSFQRAVALRRPEETLGPSLAQCSDVRNPRIPEFKAIPALRGEFRCARGGFKDGNTRITHDADATAPPRSPLA